MTAIMRHAKRNAQPKWKTIASRLKYLGWAFLLAGLIIAAISQFPTEKWEVIKVRTYYQLVQQIEAEN
jgi:hypothetical protein